MRRMRLRVWLGRRIGGGERERKLGLAGGTFGNLEGQNTTIGGGTFRHFRVSDAAMSHYENSDIYRSFHGGKCYELVIQEMTTSADVYDAGTQKFSKEDEAEVKGKLMQALQSFRFLR